MNKNTLKRCLALVLTICMVMGMFVGTVGAAETDAASITATATASVSATAIGHYPVEFELKNPTATNLSVTLVKTTGEAEFNYQGTSAKNGVIELSARTEQKVTGYLSFTDPAKQQTDVTIQVKSGATVLSTMVIDITGASTVDVKSAYYSFDKDLEGWSGSRVFRDGNALHILGFGGSSETNMWAHSGHLQLLTGGLYRLSFKSKTTTIFGNDIDGFVVFVQDFDKDGNALALPYSVAAGVPDSVDYADFSCVFVANASADPNYSYSTISFNAGGTNSGNEGRVNLWIDDVLLVEAGKAEMIEVPNGDFETFDAAGFSTVANGFTGWQTANTERQGTTQTGWGSKTSEPYSGKEMMGVIPGHGLRYNTKEYTETEEVTFTAFFKLYSGQLHFEPKYHLGVVEDDPAVKDNHKVLTTLPLMSTEWQSASATYTKPSDVEKFYIGLDMTNQNEGGWADYVLMFKSGAVSNVTSKQIADGGKISGFTGTLPPAGDVAVPVLPTIPAPSVIVTVYDEAQLTAALAAGSNIRMEADITVTGAVDMTGVDMNGHKLTMTETASVKGVDESVLVVPKRYELVNTDGTYTIQKIYVGSVANAGRSLSLEGEIYINQYVTIDGFAGVDVSKAGGLLIFNSPVTAEEATIENADAVVPGLIEVEDGMYAQQTPGIAAKEYADEVYLCVYVQDTNDSEGYYYYGPVMEYSVQDYCESRLANSSNETMKKLAAAMLHYGAAAQNYFDYNTSDLANANIKAQWPAEAFDPALISALKPVNTILRDSGDIITVGKTLSLDGAISINAYYAPATSVTWTVEKAELLVWDGVKGELTKENASYVVDMVQDGTRWAAATNEFAAKEMGKTVFMAAKITDNNGRSHMTEVIAYSPEAYAAGRIANSNNPEMVELAERMVIYGEYAKQYFGWSDEVTDEEPEAPENPDEPGYTPEIPTEQHPSVLNPDKAPHGDYVVYEGMPQAHIMLTEDADHLEELAAEELQYHVELVTGAKLPINTVDLTATEFSGYATPTAVYAEGMGYVPVEFTLKNPTADEQVVTLVQKEDSDETEPELTVRGDLANNGTVTIAPYGQVVVSGHFKVEDTYALPISIVEVDVVNADGDVLCTMPVICSGRESALEGDFEGEETGFVGGVADANFKYAQEQSMRIPGGTEAVAEKQLVLSTGHMYYLGFYGAGKVLKTEAMATVTDYDANGNVLEDVPMSLHSRSALKKGSWGWHEFYFVGNTNDDPNYAYSVLSLNNTKGADMWVDGLVLIDCGMATRSHDGVSGNEGFETLSPHNTGLGRFPGWSILGNFVYTDEPYEGSQALGWSPTNGYLNTSFTAKTAERTYVMSFWAKGAKGGETFTASTNPMVNYAGADPKTKQTFTLSTEWERYTFIYETPEKPPLGVAYHGTYVDCQHSGTIYMDMFRWHELDTALELKADQELGVIEDGIKTVVKKDFEDTANGYLEIAEGTSDNLDGRLSLQSDNLYRLGFYAKTDDADAVVYATVTDFDSNGAVMATPMSLYNRTELTSDWTYYEYRFAGNSSGAVDFGESELSFKAVNGDVQIDDVVLMDLGYGEENELPNADFEEAYTGVNPEAYPKWWLHVDGGMGPGEGYSGKQSMRVRSRNAGLTFGVRNSGNFATKLGAFTYAMWIKAPEDATVRTVKFLVTSGLNGAVYKTYEFETTTEWERYEFTFDPAKDLTPEQSASWKGCQVLFTLHDSGSTYFEFDLASLRNTQIANEVSTDGVIAEGIASGKTQAYSGKLELTTGNLYRLSFEGKGSANGSTVLATVNDYNAKGKALTVPMSANDDTTLTGEWAPYEVYFVHNPIVDGNYDHSKITFTAGNSRVMVQNVVLEDLGKPEDEQLSNGDFEVAYNNNWDNYDPQRHPGWYQHLDGYIGSGSDVYSGSQSCAIRYRDNAHIQMGLAYDTFFPDAPQEFDFSFWMKMQSKSGETGKIEVKVVKQGMRENSEGDMEPYVMETYKTYTFYPSMKFERFELTFDPYAELTEEQLADWDGCTIRYEVFGMDDHSSKCYMDAASLRAIDTTESGTVIDLYENEDEEVEEVMPAEPTLDAPAINGLTFFLVTPESYPALDDTFGEELDWIGDSDGFSIQQKGGIIYIMGTKSRGVMNGVYDFIEDNLGVVWFRADDIAYDPMTTVKAGSVNYHEKSPFMVRSWHLGGTGDQGEPFTDSDTELMMTRMKMNAKQAAVQNQRYWNYYESIGLNVFHNHHNISELITSSPVYDPNNYEYWNTDEEGNYITVNPENPIAYNINFFTDLTVYTIVERMKVWMKANESPYLPIGQNDSDYMVNLPYSAMPFEYAPGQFVQPDDHKYKSTVFFTWLNKIAREIKAIDPTRKIVTMAYSFTQTPPLCPVEDNILIVFCPVHENLKTPMYVDNPEDPNHLDFIELDEWSKMCDNIVIYNYYGVYFASNYYPRPIYERIQWDMQYFADMGFAGVDPEGGVDATTRANEWAINSMTYWLFHKLAWNPYEDVDALIDHYLAKVFGPAAEPMRRFYDSVLDAWNASDDVVINYRTPTADYLTNFVVGTGYELDQQKSLMDAWEIVTQPGNELYKKRLQYLHDTYLETLSSFSDLYIQEGSAMYTTAGKEAVLAATDYTSEIWANTQVLDNCYQVFSLKPVEGAKTQARVLWDEDYIYVGYEMFDDSIANIKTTTVYSSSSNSWWNAKSDDVETYLTLHDPKEADYYAYFCNPSGLNFRYLFRNNFRRHDPTPCDWDFTTVVQDKPGVEEDKWILIQAISWESLGLSGKATQDTKLWGYFYRMYNDENNAEQQISWNGGEVWTPDALRPIALLK